MINFFYELNPLIQTILASSITFFATSMGAFIVYLLKFNSKRLTNIFLKELDSILPNFEKKGIALALENLPFLEGYPNEKESLEIINKFD